jgi:four helix bundle protein
VVLEVRGFGINDASVISMGGARSFTELHAWQLANELKRGVYGLIDSTRARHDTKFSDQLRDAAASAPRNIAEGFGRYQPKEFSQYLRVANGSLMETSNHLRDGVDRGYFTQSQIDPLLTLAKRASAAVTRLIRYLRHARPPEPLNPEP